MEQASLISFLSKLISLVVVFDEQCGTLENFIVHCFGELMMMNCFCGMVDRPKVFSLIFNWDHCQRSSPSRISNTPWSEFEPEQNLSSGLVEWSCAVVITTTPRRSLLFEQSALFLSVPFSWLLLCSRHLKRGDDYINLWICTNENVAKFYLFYGLFFRNLSLTRQCIQNFSE